MIKMDLVEALSTAPRQSKPQKDAPKVLLWDIENSPAVGEFWGKPYNTNIVRIVKPSSVICFAARWLDGTKIEFWSEFHHGRETMLDHAWELINEADALVSYNGQRHDTPHMTTELKLAGYPRTTPAVEIDLYRAVRRSMAFQQNKLAFVAEQLGIGSKVAHEGHDLWVRCGLGDRKAWEIMKKYNIQDVNLLGDLYYECLEWLPQNMLPHPGLYVGNGDVCGACGHEVLILEEKPYRTALSAYPMYRCASCNHLNRGKKALHTVGARAI